MFDAWCEVLRSDVLRCSVLWFNALLSVVTLRCAAFGCAAGFAGRCGVSANRDRHPLYAGRVARCASVSVYTDCNKETDTLPVRSGAKLVYTVTNMRASQSSSRSRHHRNASATTRDSAHGSNARFGHAHC